MTYQNIHINLKKRFKELTDKDNFKMYGNKYFIPIEKVFVKRLTTACIEYSMDDLEKIEKVLLNHVEMSIKNNFPKYTRTIEYFIYGQNGKDCQLATEYENIDSELVTGSDEKKFKLNVK